MVKETFDVDIDKPKLYNQIIRAHYETLKYSESELADMLYINESDLAKLNLINGIARMQIAI